jgi:hypothetical protein
MKRKSVSAIVSHNAVGRTQANKITASHGIISLEVCGHCYGNEEKKNHENTIN